MSTRPGDMVQWVSLNPQHENTKVLPGMSNVAWHPCCTRKTGIHDVTGEELISPLNGVKFTCAWALYMLAALPREIQQQSEKLKGESWWRHTEMDFVWIFTLQPLSISLGLWFSKSSGVWDTFLGHNNSDQVETKGNGERFLAWCSKTKMMIQGVKK